MAASNDPSVSDQGFMARALALAEQGRGWVNPNPMVGAVVVRDGQVVGEGFHPRVGAPHAEVIALEAAGEAARGATLYVTLEPCCHTHKRTPPCLDRVLAAGLSRVVVAMADPNPLVAGRSLAAMREAGLAVAAGVLEDRARGMNEPFCKHVRTGMPFVVLKMAMSADGKTATRTGESRWISGEPARHRVHSLRTALGAVMVGIGTALADDPRLDCRIAGARQPLRVVVDPRAELSPSARMFAVEGAERPLVVVAAEVAPDRLDRLRDCAEVIAMPRGDDPGHVDLVALVRLLGDRAIPGVLIEGGAALNASALAAGIVDKVVFFVAPKLIGGAIAPGPIGGVGVAKMTEALPLNDLTATPCGEDLMIEAYLHPRGAMAPLIESASCSPA